MTERENGSQEEGKLKREVDDREDILVMGKGGNAERNRIDFVMRDRSAEESRRRKYGKDEEFLLMEDLKKFGVIEELFLRTTMVRKEIKKRDFFG